MDAGKLDRRVTILRYSMTRNADNEPIETWSDLATVWASKKDISDGEKVRAAQIGASLSTRFQIRWSSLVADVNPKDRLRYGGRTYEIVGVKELGRRDGIEISALSAPDEPA